MKSILALAAVGVAALGFAGSASAFKLSPASTKFTGTGPTSATLNGITLACHAILRGATNALGVGHVTGGSFSGAVGCTAVKFTGTPWLAKATTATTGTVYNIDFSSPLGACGPANMVDSLSGGVISYNGPFDQCSNVTLALTTKPTLSIVP
jgi:hypothetical protein